MVIQNVTVNDCTPQTIVIGRRGTYDTMQIAFDLTNLVQTYGSGTAVLAVKRSQDASAYPAVTSQADNTLTWTITETDTYYVGSGECQLMWYVDGGLAKTIIYPMVVMRDILSTTEEPPDGYENWVEHLTELGAETQQNAQAAAQSASEAEQAKDDAVDAKEASEEAARKAEESSVHAPIIVNGYWYAWDATTETYQNTGVKAEGHDGTDGFSPVITVTDITGGHRVTITDADGTQTVDVMNGTDGTNGDDGYSPIVTVTNITGGHRVTITDETHPGGQSFDVMDGASDAGGVAFDPTQTYPDGSAGKALTDQKNAISQKAPVIINTASGDIATFADGADGMPIKHLVANIEPVQSGTGDPSPENIRPITGWTGLTGARTGKNLLDTSAVTSKTANGITMTVNKDSNGSTTSIVLNGTATASFSLSLGSAVLAPGTYVFKTLEGGVGTLGTLYVNYSGIINAGSSNVTATLTETKTTNVSISIANGTVVNNVVYYPMIRRAGEDATYEPYQPIQPISVSWATEAGTVYRGTIDMITGELTVDYALVTINGTNYPTGIAATSAATATALVQVLVPDIALVNEYDSGKVISDYLPSTTDYTIYRNASPAVAIHYDTSAPNRRLWFRLPNITTEADAKTYLANNPLTVVYALATPQTYHLDPVTVNTLLGNNTVYVDCGSVTVDYPVDTTIAYTEQKNAISQKQDATNYVTLSGTIVTQTGADNTMYLCGELAELTFTAPATGQTAIRFSSGTTPTVATFSGVTWLNGFDPSAIEASKTYEINILYGVGVASWT